ncbi:MAG: amidohydrolase family protein [Candidatus Thiodiazotropha sp. (ex Epidulcina cf. delphinae)]|nr:amidohydrolase family protein [Candidatus Thiodiazotropha sp. (ex Epidulcina cf. delphinae)]
MKTIDIHTHLLSPEVAFDRLFDKVAVRFFANSLGADPAQLMARPYQAYIEAMAQAIAGSRYVEKACLFGVDARFDEQGKEIDRDKTVCAMSDDVLAVANSYPDRFIPFFSINPRRPNALELIDEQVEKGSRGAKFLQNYWGVDLNDERLIPYYEKLKQHKLPLIVHIGSEYSIHSYPRFERIDMLDLPLATGITVIAAHMGLGRINHKLRFWRNLSKDPRYFDEDYFRLLAMLKEHDNLYADISAITAPLRARALRHLSEQRDVHDKLLFGTDYPVPFPIRFNSYDLPTTTRRQIGLVDNPFDRYVAVMLEYFPQDNPIYRNHQKVLLGGEY